VLENVVVLNDFAETNGGAAQVALASALGLAANGHRVILFSAVTPAVLPFHQNLNVVVTGQHEIVDDPNRTRAIAQGLWNVKARGMLRQILIGLDPKRTIVHLHGWSKALSSSVVRECVAQRFRVVCTLHDYFVACPNGGFYNYRTHQICRLRALSPACLLENCDARSYPQKVWRVARQVIQRRVGEIPDGIDSFISVSKFSSAILRPYLPRDCRVFDVPNPVISTRSPCANPADPAPFLYVGRLSPEKGGELLASAAAELDCDVVYVGDGASRAAIESCGNSRIHVTGWLPRAQVLTRLAGARALILPSLWYETQGMVVLEAAALGVPAIVPDTSAARDLVKNGETGLWFKGGDVTSLRAMMKRLMVASLARDFGRRAYDQYWENPPTVERHVQGLERAYTEILEGAHRG
jgi:glycosyltransferase involved in cell wall biosynthesis